MLVNEIAGIAISPENTPGQGWIGDSAAAGGPAREANVSCGEKLRLFQVAQVPVKRSGPHPQTPNTENTEVTEHEGPEIWIRNRPAPNLGAES